jgi:N utilization substance protein A
MAVTNELGQEKIDIIEWSEEIEAYLANSLSPAQVNSVDTFDRREARVFVPDDQLSLAIGKGGQNVRLAAKLTGWKIDVRSSSDPDAAQEGGVANSEGITVAEETAREVADSMEHVAEEIAVSPEAGDTPEERAEDITEEPVNIIEEDTVTTSS